MYNAEGENKQTSAADKSPERVEIGDIIDPNSSARELMPEKEIAGLVLAGVVLGLITVFTLTVIIYWFRTAPSLNSFGVPVTEESLKLYKEASQVIFDRISKMLDIIIVTVLLPILTLILGYIFGSRVRNKG